MTMLYVTSLQNHLSLHGVAPAPQMSECMYDDGSALLVPYGPHLHGDPGAHAVAHNYKLYSYKTSHMMPQVLHHLQSCALGDVEVSAGAFLGDLLCLCIQ